MWSQNQSLPSKYQLGVIENEPKNALGSMASENYYRESRKLTFVASPTPSASLRSAPPPYASLFRGGPQVKQDWMWLSNTSACDAFGLDVGS